MRDILQEIVIIILSLLLIVLFIFCAHQASIHRNDKQWNDGHCDICGGTWKYEQAVGHRSSTTFIYVCGKCGKRIELSKVR